MGASPRAGFAYKAIHVTGGADLTCAASMKMFVSIAVLTLVTGCKSKASHSSQPFTSYVITEHKVIPPTGSSLQVDEYTVVYGVDILKVKYSSSQTSSAKPGDFFGTGLHPHSYYSNPDLSQVPQVGVPIRRCELSKNVMPDGSPIIATQPTPEPCMVQIGDTLQYEPSPNAGAATYVDFDILSERARPKE